jgi:hypothetical protein
MDHHMDHHLGSEMSPPLLFSSFFSVSGLPSSPPSQGRGLGGGSDVRRYARILYLFYFILIDFRAKIGQPFTTAFMAMIANAWMATKGQ